MENNTIKTYKGFNKDMTCRGFRYEEGKEYEHNGNVRACQSGFHACENPFDVLGFYPPCDDKGNLRRYCEVEQSGTLDRSEDDKVCSSRLRVVAEIGLNGLIKAGVRFILDKVNFKDTKESNTGNRSAATNTGSCSAATNTGSCSAATNTGNRSAATNTGNWSAATNTGDWSAATNTGSWSAATNTGNWSAATNTGNWSAATNTGSCSAATNTGNRSAATNTGDQSAATNTGSCSAATNTGDWSAATNTGDWSAAKVEGEESIAVVTGYESKAKGALGCWLVLTERDENRHILGVKAVKVDGESVKPDRWYALKNGEITECDD